MPFFAKSGTTMKHSINKIKLEYKSLFFAYMFLMLLSLIFQISHGISWASLSVIDVNHGQYWRLLTAHLTHFDWPHFSMNMIGMGLCMLVYNDSVCAKHWLASFVFISLFSSIGLLIIYDEQQRYAGFSDVLHGWILLGALAIANKERKLTIAIFVLFWLKILEENSGLTFFTSASMSTENIATQSHIFGALGGMFYAFLFIKPAPVFSRLGKKPNK